MKNRLPQIITVFLLAILLISCSKAPQVIDYGKDQCHSCQMTIVDKIHGSELITDKGKVYKFDAAECLIRYKNKLTESTEGYQFVTNYFEMPSGFIALNEGYFLISENLPSPMGANLTAFKTEEAIVKVHQEKGGKMYTWSELENYFKENK